MMFHATKTKTYGYKKANYISVSIKMTKSKHSSKHKAPATASPSVSPTSSKNIDVNNLFSDVWTKKINNSVKKPENKRRIEQIQKKISTTKKNNVESVTQKLNALKTTHASPEEATSAANEVNEYLAKIQDIVYQHFNVPQNSEGNSVKTVIELDPFGKLIDFRILSYSNNEALNQEADMIKERLKNVVFPVNPQNRSSKTIVILISKE